MQRGLITYLEVDDKSFNAVGISFGSNLSIIADQFFCLSMFAVQFLFHSVWIFNLFCGV
jgi:hypothetical protein